MHQYLHWYGCERSHFEYNTAHLFRKQYAYMEKSTVTRQ
ncbi:hypothetical protein M23134_07406 [Microscilla marina ATCC 23134]|uniref:Uncharacterized protein n=1 Tax=Microscilla marina ATCC 23134 TaxID=313606 RepID=A1ZEP7_MICM2|nr:hypothetical protein M23134_07406 [Microscilla marina ATCC 23134]